MKLNLVHEEGRQVEPMGVAEFNNKKNRVEINT